MPALRCGYDLTLKTLRLAGIRKPRFRALGALLVTCVFIPGANAGQASTGDKPQPKPTTTNSTAQPGSPASATKSTTTHATSAKHHSSRRRRSARVRGQKKIDAERARTIQEALIREHYLSGEPTGTWNQASEDAMRRYQSDHGWQTKEVPDSRALISLGLGPSKDHLLNPESAMTTGPEPPAAASPATSPKASPATSPTATPQSTPAPLPTPVPNQSQNDPSSPQR